MSLLPALRTATAPIHERLDGSLGGGSFASGDALAGYLGCFHRALCRCWPAMDWQALERHGLDHTDERRARYEALGSDLVSWGRRPDPLPATGAPGVPETVGTAYVLEGSVHGGRVILARASEAFGPLPADRCRFLHAFGPRTGALWAGFATWMDALDADDDFTRRACDAACRTFGVFLEEFQPFSPSPTP